MSIAPFNDENADLLNDDLRVDPVLHLVGAPIEVQSRTMTEHEVRDAVALHVAATILSPTATLTDREQTRQRWLGVLKTVMTLSDYPDWALAYLPGVHHGDNDTYAVHLPTARVFGGDCARTAQRWNEGTYKWLARLTEGLDDPDTQVPPRLRIASDG